MKAVKHQLLANLKLYTGVAGVDDLAAWMTSGSSNPAYRLTRKPGMNF